LLRSAPRLKAITLLRKLQEDLQSARRDELIDAIRAELRMEHAQEPLETP